MAVDDSVGVGVPMESRRVSMRTLGVDLSVAQRRTAVLSVDWGPSAATVAELQVGLGDGELASLVAAAGWVGVSAPFGWPGRMVSALHAYFTVGSWPEVDKASFRYRVTDLFVHRCLLEETGRKVWPLSVSSDGIALRAWRLGRLREEVAQRSGVRFDRAGADGVLEVFPGAALLLWGFERGVYRKREGGRSASELSSGREEFLSSLEAEAPWLRWSAGSRESCLGNEDAMDALICALVARAASVGMTRKASVDQGDDAKREGWVHLPERDGLRGLVGNEVEVATAV